MNEPKKRPRARPDVAGLEAAGLWLEGRVAEFLGKRPATLRKMRITGAGPASIKLGQTVLYRREVVLDWVRSLERPGRSA